MYYPKQIPYLLDPDFKKNIEYVEHNILEFEDYCMCIWEMKSKNILDKSIAYNILPDACIDLIVDFMNRTIFFAGFSNKTEPFPLNKKIDYIGVRLKPGAFYSLFHVDANKIMDHIIPFIEIEREINIQELLFINDTFKRIEYLKDYLSKKVSTISNTHFITVVNELYENPKNQTILNITHTLNYQKRQLYRIFKKNYGISPKVLLNILRLHLCLTLLLEKNVELIDIAIQCGFYDQSHFINEIKKYTKISLLKLFDKYQI